MGRRLCLILSGPVTSVRLPPRGQSFSLDLIRGALPHGKLSQDGLGQATARSVIFRGLTSLCLMFTVFGSLPWWLAAPCLLCYPAGPVCVIGRGTTGVSSVAYCWSRLAAALLRVNRKCDRIRVRVLCSVALRAMFARGARTSGPPLLTSFSNVGGAKFEHCAPRAPGRPMQALSPRSSCL